MNNLSVDELLNKAFSLACFILGDREDAVRAVEEAMARLDVTAAAQGKRLYYKPSWLRQQEKSDRYRNKVLFSQLHLLQRLVYIASEPYEERREQSMVANKGGEEEMLIHFIKHLARITTRRNSFYVTLGISRLLYNYTTAETMEVYNAVIQDPERVKDDYYYRSRKGVLMQELKKRFGSLLEIARGPRGEERFHAAPEQTGLLELVKESLSFFTPWYTPCLVPAGVNPIMDGITGLESHGKEEEDKIEVDRIHAVLHPDCHGRLIKSLGFDEPASRLEVPHFFLSTESGRGDGSRGGGRGNDRRHAAALSHHELDEIKGHLDEQSSRRKRAFAGLLRVVVDGSERARLDLSQSSRARFALDGDAELLEVRAMIGGDDLLLASHLFKHDELRDSAEDASIVLEGGQKVAIKVSPATDKTEAIVDVAYRETNPLRAFSLYLKQLTRTDSSRSRSWTSGRVPAFALTFALLALCAFGVVQFLRQRNRAPEPVASKQQPTQINQTGDNNSAPVKHDEAKSSGAAVAPPLATAAPVEKQKGAPPKVAPRKTATVPPSEVAKANEPVTPAPAPPNRREPGSTREVTPRRDAPEDTTRAPSKTAATPLAQVKKIYVEVNGDAGDLRAKIIQSLTATGRFVAVESKNEAEALMRVTVKSEGGASVLLINERGEITWRSTGANLTGSNESVADGIVKELLDVASKNGRH